MKIIEDTLTHTTFEDIFNNQSVIFVKDKLTNEIKVNRQDFAKCLGYKDYDLMQMNSHKIMQMFEERIALAILLNPYNILFD